MPRGGKRTGAPGKAYGNRKDLSVNKGPVPVANYASGQPYGTGVALKEAQQQMAVSSPQPPAGVTGGPTTPPGPPGAPQGPLPGSLGDFARPTERPNEPITHGLPTGPGGGPEVLAPTTTRPAQTLLAQVANQPFASDEIKSLLSKLGG